MKMTVNTDDFQSSYRLRSGHFTCDGIKAFSVYCEHFAEDTGTPLEPGPIEIQCDWKQYFTFREYQAHQGGSFTSLEELESEHTVIRIPSGGFIVHLF